MQCTSGCTVLKEYSYIYKQIDGQESTTLDVSSFMHSGFGLKLINESSSMISIGRFGKICSIMMGGN